MLNLLESYEDEAQMCIGEPISTLTTIFKTFWTYYDLLMYVRYSDRRTEVIFAVHVKVSKDLQDYEDRLSDIHNDTVTTAIKFGKNIKLPNLQTEIEFPGHKNNQWGREILLDSKILSKKQVKSQLPDDRCKPWGMSTVVMPDGEIVLCDRDNRKLKLLDSSDEYKSSLILEDSPWDISVVNITTVIVTLPHSEQLKYVEVIPRLTSGRVLQPELDTECWGVHVIRDKIFTTCRNFSREWDVRMLDLDGNFLKQLGINQDGSFMFTTPLFISVSPSEEKVFISDSDKHTVTCMTLNNHVIYQYTDNEMKVPTNIVCDGADKILVCGRDSENVQVITEEGKKHCNLLSSRDGLKWPNSISYREIDDTLIVGCDYSDYVFSILTCNLNQIL